MNVSPRADETELKNTVGELFKEVTNAIIEGKESTDSLEITEKKIDYKINFNMKFYTDTNKDSSIYYSELPKITIGYYKDDATTEADYKMFDNLESLTNAFYTKINDQSFDKTSLSIFRSHYKSITGGSTATTAITNYLLTIDYEIILKLTQSQGEISVDKYLLKINNLTAAQTNDSFQKSNIFTTSGYNFDTSDLNEIDKKNINENLKKIVDSKKENDMINFDISNPTKEQAIKIINELSGKLYQIDADDNEFFNQWVNYQDLNSRKERFIQGTDIQLLELQNWIFDLLGYEFIRINRLLMVFNTDIFVKILTLLSNDKYAKTYIEFMKFIYLKVDLKNLKYIYTNDDDDIYKTIAGNTQQYNNIMKASTVKSTISTLSSILGSTTPEPSVNTGSQYIFSYLLFKKLFNDFFGSEDTPNATYGEYTNLKGMGELDSNCKIFRIMLYLLWNIEKNIIFVLKIIYNKTRTLQIQNIEKNFIELTSENKRVVSIVKRRHDFFKYDEKHPLYDTKINDKGVLKYLDLYYVNKPETIRLFTYYDPYSRYRLTTLQPGEDKTKLESFRSANGFNETSNKVTIDDKPTYFYMKDDKATRFDSTVYNEKHKFGPFDYLYNKDSVTNQQIADDIQIRLTNNFLDGNNIMMNGFGQSGSGKTSTLIKLIKGDGTSEDGVLINYLKKLNGKINSVTIECVNLYYVEDSSKPISDYDSFSGSNYKVEIYGATDAENKNITDFKELPQATSARNVVKKIVQQGNNFDKMRGEVGDEILKLFDRRQVLPTPNNEKSSRSHIVVCLTFGAQGLPSQEYDNKKLVVCDLAGVENVFKCDDDLELMKFDSQYDMIYNKADKDAQAKVTLQNLGLSGTGTIGKCGTQQINNLSIRLLKADDDFASIKDIKNYKDILTSIKSKKGGAQIDNTANFTNLKNNLTALSSITNYNSTTDINDGTDYTILRENVKGATGKGITITANAKIDEINKNSPEVKTILGDLLNTLITLKGTLDMGKRTTLMATIKEQHPTFIKSIKITIESIIKSIESNIAINKKNEEADRAERDAREKAEREAREKGEADAAERKRIIAKSNETAICFDTRFKKIGEDCIDRVKEGFMINRSLAELSNGISTIVYENSFEGLPIYIEKQIDPKCRNNFLDYYIFDKFKEKSLSNQANIEEDYKKYGIILCILKYYYEMDLTKLIFYNLLVYNTSFFSQPSLTDYKIQGVNVPITDNNKLNEITYPEPKDNNVGSKNNPPNPPYVNINILKYFTRINKNKKKLRKIAEYFWKYVIQYPFYSNSLPPLQDADIYSQMETWITIIDRNNAGTLIGTLETTDMLQTVAFKDVGCNNISSGTNSQGNTGHWSADVDPASGNIYYTNMKTNETQWEKPPEFDQQISQSGSTDENYNKIIEIFKETTDKIVKNCEQALLESKMIVGNTDPEFKKYINETLFQKRFFQGNVSKDKAEKLRQRQQVSKGGKTHRKYKNKRKTIKRRLLKTRRPHRNSIKRKTHKKF